MWQEPLLIGGISMKAAGNMIMKAKKVTWAGASRIIKGGDTRTQSMIVRMNTERSAPMIHMGMKIDYHFIRLSTDLFRASGSRPSILSRT